MILNDLIVNRVMMDDAFQCISEGTIKATDEEIILITVRKPEKVSSATKHVLRNHLHNLKDMFEFKQQLFIVLNHLHGVGLDQYLDGQQLSYDRRIYLCYEMLKVIYRYDAFSDNIKYQLIALPQWRVVNDVLMLREIIHLGEEGNYTPKHLYAQIGLLMEKILMSKNEHHIQFMNNLILGNVFYPTLDVLIQHFKDIFIYEKPEAIDAIPFEYHLTFSVSNNDSFAVAESSTNENLTFSFTAHDVAPADFHPTVTSTSDAEVDETETMAQDVSDAEVDETESMAQDVSDAEADDAESMTQDVSNAEADDAETMAQDASDDEAESMVQDVLNAGVDDAESMTQDVSDAEVDETETMTQDVSDDEADDAKSMTQDVSNAEADEAESMTQDVSDAEADDAESMAQDVSDAEVDEIESMAQDVSNAEADEIESMAQDASDAEADDTEMVFANTMESFSAPSTHYTDKETAVLDGSTAADLPDFCDLTPSEDPFETSVKPAVEPFVEPAYAPQKKRQSTARKSNSEMSKSWQAIIFPIAMTLIFIAVVAFGIKSFFFKPEIFEASYRIETLSDDRVAFINTSACSKPIESCEWSVYYDDQLIQSFITDNLYPIFDTVGEYTISLRIMDADGNWSNTYSEVYPYGQSQ
jgi:hypothetical protein